MESNGGNRCVANAEWRDFLGNQGCRSTLNDCGVFLDRQTCRKNENWWCHWRRDFRISRRFYGTKLYDGARLGCRLVEITVRACVYETGF